MKSNTTLDESQTADLADQLVKLIEQFASCAVAFSGGIDSAVVAMAAFLAKGARAVAVTGVGAAVSELDKSDADEVANQIGIRHVKIATNEILNPAYTANDSQRCFHCKSELYQQIRHWCDHNGIAAILSGTNRDDLGDYRPGLRAAAQFDVRSPLAELGIGKREIRLLAGFWNLSIADKPASPCLASRIAYGQVVSIERLTKIEKAERWLGARGFQDVRVRLHADNVARIELHEHDIPKLFENALRAEIVQVFREFGFDFITLDINGRESGSLNRVIRS